MINFLAADALSNRSIIKGGQPARRRNAKRAPYLP
jgi:hypothetical protein